MSKKEISDFVMQPIHKKLNRGNIITRVEKLESGDAGAQPSARVEALGEIGQSTGSLTVDELIVVNHDTGLADVIIDNLGITFRNQEGDITFLDTNGNQDTLLIYSDGVNDIVLKNAYGGRGIRFDVDDASHNVRQHAITYDGMNIDAGAQYYIDGQPPGGTYTPTLTNTTNIDSSAVIGPFPYMRVGNFVSVSGSVTIDPTAAAPTATALGISLPIASNFAAASDGSGVGSAQATNTTGSITADVANDRMTLSFQATGTASTGWRVMFMYQIL